MLKSLRLSTLGVLVMTATVVGCGMTAQAPQAPANVSYSTGVQATQPPMIPGTQLPVYQGRIVTACDYLTNADQRRNCFASEVEQAEAQNE